MRPANRRTDRILFWIFLLSLIVYIVLFSTAFSNLPLNLAPWHQAMLLYFHSIPTFCLQLLLCRRANLRWRLLLPTFPLIVTGVFFLSFVDWHIMGWALFLLWCAAPILGSALAWAVWGMGRLVQRRRGDTYR